MVAPVLLCILDGVGLAPPGPGNAFALADTPYLDSLLADAPHSKLRTDGPYVGLPDGQMGNSEVGHMTIGSGRIIRQALDQVRHDLRSGEFAAFDGFTGFASEAAEARAIHLFGLLSTGGVHSHMDHIVGIAEKVSELGRPVFLHGMTDGRDTDPHAAGSEIGDLLARLAKLKNVTLATLVGRYYGMDRDARWERMALAWRLWTRGEGRSATDPVTAIRSCYEENLSDEFLPAINLLPGRVDHWLRDGDAAMVCNFRADRARQMVELMMQTEASQKVEPIVRLRSICTLTEYKSDFPGPVHVVYPNREYSNLLGAVVADAGLSQLRISETEKYAHVTYYLNCGRETPFPGEERLLINSPKDVATYDQKPEMSLPAVTDAVVEAIHSGKYGLIVLNVANGDQVGHTGNVSASIDAMEFVDASLRRIMDAVIQASGEAIIIADHGNIEELLVDGSVSTAHSTNPVPCIYVGKKTRSLHDGSLKDVAPTILDLLGLPLPPEMTGRTLLTSTST